ncbi:unnamed protein product [Ectocarpus sp. CCAP 1310/34]|nr:unnamed protein product [Ectocarpus sp. CCAP 1310/34]
MRPQRHGSWSAQDDLKVGRHTVRLKRSLGEGGFAFIHLVEDVNTGRLLVLKRSSLQSHEGRVIYEKEASIMRSLAHPNIVQIVTAVELQSSKTGAILMEFCPRGHLLEALNSLGGKLMEEEAVLSVMCDIVSAVKYLHDKGITHRDVKLENILRSSSGSHKLCDFGSCVQGRVPLDTAEQRANEEEVVEKTTTQMYRAPEMVDLYLERELTERVDIWALGCILYAVCYLKNPFQDAGNLGILNAKIRIPDDSVFSSGLVDLIRRCLTASPTHRPSASEVEAGIHALSKGNPLPPPRHKKKSSEADCGHAAGTAAASVAGVAAQAATAPASNSGGLSNSVGALARNVVGGRGDAGSGRTVTAAGAVGKSYSQQVLTPPKAKPVAAQPQLNPNSVAARRLASRKGSASANNTGSRNCLVPPPPPPPSEQRPDDDGGAPGGSGGSPTGWPGASTAAAAVATVASGACGGDGHPDPDGWGNFAAFDQFPEALDLSTSGRQQGSSSNFGAAPLESPVAAVGESPQVMNVTPPVSEKRQSGGKRAVAGGVAALGEQLEGTSFMPPPPQQQQQQQQQQRQQQQLVGKITQIGRAASLGGGGGGNQQRAWLMASPAGQAAPGGDRPLSGRVENGFSATFPRQASGGGGVASDGSIGIGSSPQRRQQQQRQQPSRSPSPPPPPPQAVVLRGAATSPTQSMACLSPSVGTAGSMQQQGLGQVPQLQQQRQRWSAQQQQQQWQAGNTPADVGQAFGNNNASWNNGSSATWSAAERMMGGGVDGVSGSPPIAASLSIPTLQERESSSGRQQQHQKFGSIPPPTQPQFPGTGGPW